jgi:eukaryotic-like serine/threonine-protein kinase
MLSIGTRLGPYEIIALLGAGGMGEVYGARDPRLGRDVAIKVLPTAVSADAAHLRRFDQEARAAASLNHPNILAVYDIGTHDGSPYIVSELLDGETLRAALHVSPLPWARAAEIALQLLAGLDAAHIRGIVHRDLKPDNVFVTRAGVVKILDFGLARPWLRAPRMPWNSTSRGRPGQRPACCSGPWGTWRPSRSEVNRPGRGQIFSRSARFSMRC